APAGSTTGDRNAPNLFSVEWAQYATSPRLRPPDMVGALTNPADLVALGSLWVGMPEWGLAPLFSGLFVGPRGSVPTVLAGFQRPRSLLRTALDNTRWRTSGARPQGCQRGNLGRTPDGRKRLIVFSCHTKSRHSISPGGTERGRVERSHSGISQSCFGGVKLTVATGVAYFLAARLGLVLRVDRGVAVFWAASGVAIGALIALGPKARLPLAVAVFLATAASNLMIGRDPWLTTVFGLLNASQTLFTAWLLERRFGRTFNLEGVQRVLAFLAAAAAGSALAAAGAAVAIAIYSPTASPLQVWGLWFAASSLG